MLKFKTEISVRIGNYGTRNFKNRKSLKYLHNFWRTLAMPLINCEINFILTWFNRFFVIDNPIACEEPTCKDVNLSAQDNANPLLK